MIETGLQEGPLWTIIANSGIVVDELIPLTTFTYGSSRQFSSFLTTKLQRAASFETNILHLQSFPELFRV